MPEGAWHRPVEGVRVRCLDASPVSPESRARCDPADSALEAEETGACFLPAPDSGRDLETRFSHLSIGREGCTWAVAPLC